MLLGHKNTENASRYAHVLTSDLRDWLIFFNVLALNRNVQNPCLTKEMQIAVINNIEQ